MWPTNVLSLFFPCRNFCAENFLIFFYEIKLLFTYLLNAVNETPWYELPSGLGIHLAAVTSRVQILARACWLDPKIVETAFNAHLTFFTISGNAYCLSFNFEKMWFSAFRLPLWQVPLPTEKLWSDSG